MAFAAFSVDVTLTDEDVDISISSPALPDDVMSIPPALALNTIASAAFSDEEIFTDEPVATMSISSLPAAPEAKISIPPALDSKTTALAAVPADDITSCCVPPPATDRVKSLPEPVTVTFESSVPSIDKVVPSNVNPAESMSTAPEVTISISAALPCIVTPL